MSKSSFALVIVLLFGTAIRLIHVNQPYVDKWSYRQADVAMIAENFYLYGYDFLHPQINWAGNVPGYVGTEFPLVPMIASILYAFFGVQDWIGRSISVLFFIVSIPYSYFLYRKLITDRAALFGIAIYVLLPLSIFSGRSFMPDTVALCFMTMCLYYFLAWLENFDDLRLMIAAVGTGTVAILIKPSSLIMGLPILFLVYQKWGFSFLKKQRLWIAFAIILLPQFFWYLHAFNISITNPPHHMFGDGTIGLVRAAIYWKILKITCLSGLTLPVTATMLAGMILALIRRRAIFFFVWFAAVVAFVIILGRGNGAHAWYRIPLLPVAAAFSGIALEEVERFLNIKNIRVALGLLIGFFIVYAVESYRAVARLYKPDRNFTILSEQLRITSSPSDLIVTVDRGNPTVLYYAKRKGWHFLPVFGHGPVSSENAIQVLEDLRKQGASRFAITIPNLWWLNYYGEFHHYLRARYKCIQCTEHHVIYDLKHAVLR